MNKNASKYSASTAFLDILFNSLVCFVSLFFLAFILMNPKEPRKANTEAKAEYIITVTWAPERDDDVDSYLQDPLGHIVYFSRREDGLMHLDRDDLGKRNDKITLPDGTYSTYNENHEIVTIRGIVSGEYCLNVHMYRMNSTTPTKVNVRIEKVNPTLTLITMKDVELSQNGDEKTICRFTLNKEGKVMGLNELEKPLAIANPRVGNNDETNFVEPQRDD